MDIIFFNKLNFYERTQFFVNDGVVKKRTMVGRLGSFREMKKPVVFLDERFKIV